MADERESFPTLVNGSNVGVDLRAIIEGDSAAAKNGSLGFAFKDSAGNAVLPQLTTGGAVKVDATAVAGMDRTARGTVVGGVGVGAIADVAVLTLAISEVFNDIDIVVSSRRGALFQLVQTDDVTDTILADFVVDAGQYTVHASFDHLSISSGATGVQELKIVGYNFDKASDLRATISVLEKF